MERKKYNIGIQKQIYDIILKSKKDKEDFVTRAEIIKRLKKMGIDLEGNQVGQALYQLQQKRVFKQPRIKIIQEDDASGYTVTDDLWLWKE